jgi:hypothetical protein
MQRSAFERWRLRRLLQLSLVDTSYPILLLVHTSLSNTGDEAHPVILVSTIARLPMWLVTTSARSPNLWKRLIKAQLYENSFRIFEAECVLTNTRWSVLRKRESMCC